MRASSVNLGGSRFGVTSSSDPYVTSFVGPYANLGGLGACESCHDALFDKPYKADTTGLMLARQLGHVMGAPTLANAEAADQSKIMVRATNLANLTTDWLLQFKPEAREAMLESVASVSWTNRMLKFAKNLPGAIGISDAVRFSLGMHFMVGILDTMTKPESDNAQAYMAFAAMFKDAEAALKGESRNSGNSFQGLGGLGQATTSRAKTTAAKQAAARKAVEDAKKKDKQEDWTTDLLCKGLRTILGDAVGGAICWVITKGLQIITSAIESLVRITSTALEALRDFLVALGKGDTMGAIEALMKAVTKILFLLFLPISKPFFGMDAKRLEAMADKVAKKNPYFALALLLGIVGALNPSPASISVLILALSPALAVFLAPIIATAMKTVDKAARTSIDAIERGVEQFIKIALVVFQGAMALSDILPRLRTQVEEYLRKKGGFSGAISSMAGSAMKKLQDSWGKLLNSFKAMNFKDVASVMSTIFSVVPDVIGALGEEISKEIPAVDETIRAIKEAPGNVEKQQQMLEANSKKFYDELVPQRKEAVIIEQAKKMGLTVAKKAWKPPLVKEEPKAGLNPVLWSGLGLVGGLALAVAISRARA